MSIIYEDLEPGVINTAMIMKALENERPTGEAGRLAAEEGIILQEVTSLRLQFLNILKIDHLWMMTSLVELQLGNNIIEKIEGLNSLVNLKELDLSFNSIEVIENLEKLVKLEVLTLFENRISKLENMENLVNLMIFSIGNNQIKSRNDVIYLRQFPCLRSLNMAGNPCVENGDKDFQEYICAFLPKLTYYEYHIISAEERATAEISYRTILKRLEETEEKERQSRTEAEARAKEMTFHAEAFVENLDRDQLFNAMFENDANGKTLLTMGEAAMDVYNKFHDETMKVIHQLFKLGLEQHEIRQEEIRQYFKCVDAAKEENKISSQQYIESFLKRKDEVFLEIHNILQAVDKRADTEETSDKGEYISRLQILFDQFNDECQAAWYKLMAKELTLYEQLEETNGNFGQNINDLVSTFTEEAQSFFAQIRNLEASYNEEMSEVANAYLTNLNITTVPVSPELKQIMVNKESLNGATTQSHDFRLHTIDNRETQLLTRIHEWVKEYCDEITIGETQNSRKKVIEINHFLDIQREESEDLQASSLIAMTSPLPAETVESSGPQTAVPQDTKEEGEDATTTDTEPPESSATEEEGEDTADTVPCESSTESTAAS